MTVPYKPAPATVCVTFMRTGLPDVHCDKPAAFTVNSRPVCRKHLAVEVAGAVSWPVVVERVKP